MEKTWEDVFAEAAKQPHTPAEINHALVWGDKVGFGAEAMVRQGAKLDGLAEALRSGGDTAATARKRVRLISQNVDALKRDFAHSSDEARQKIINGVNYHAESLKKMVDGGNLGTIPTQIKHLQAALKRFESFTTKEAKKIHKSLDKASGKGEKATAAKVNKAEGKKPVAKKALADSLEGLQVRVGLDRKTFIGHAITALEKQHPEIKRLPKAKQTLPGIINHYEPHLGAKKIEELVSKATWPHAVTH